MKIAFINITQGHVDRGAETFVAELAARLGVKHQVDILRAKKHLELPRWPVLWRLYLDPQSVRVASFTLGQLPKIWRQKYDVVVPVNGGWQPALVRLVTWAYGGKMVISGQSGMGWDDRNNLWSLPDAFVALSTQAANWAKKVRPSARVDYIPNGVDIARFKPGGAKIDLELPRPVVLTVAALTKTKRVDLVIQAVAKSNASLLVVGKGPEEQSLRTFGKRLLGKRFALTSYPFGELDKVYRAADLFTLASLPYYAFEIVLAEAMATNLPVVVSDDPIRHEIVGEAGLFVNPANTAVYANALEKALTQSWNGKPRKQAEKFSWDNITEKYEKLLKELIG